MVNRFDRLRHDRIVRGDDEDDDVGHLGAPRAHLREGGVAGRVEEGDLAAVLDRHLIGADVLGDAARFSGDDVRLAERVEQRRFPVIDMAHNGDDGRTRLQRALGVFIPDKALFDVRFGDALRRMAEIGDDEFGGVGVERRVRRHHLALFHQLTDEIDRAHGHALGEFLHRNRLRNDDFANDRRGQAALLAREFFALSSALDRGERALAVVVVERVGDRQTACAAARRLLGGVFALILVDDVLALGLEAPAELGERIFRIFRGGGLCFVRPSLALGFRLGGGALAALFFFSLKRAARLFFRLAAFGRFALALSFFFGEARALGLKLNALFRFTRLTLLAFGFIALLADFLVLARLNQRGGARLLFIFRKGAKDVRLRRLVGRLFRRLFFRRLCD